LVLYLFYLLADDMGEQTPTPQAFRQ